MSIEGLPEGALPTPTLGRSGLPHSLTLPVSSRRTAGGWTAGALCPGSFGRPQTPTPADVCR